MMQDNIVRPHKSRRGSLFEELCTYGQHISPLYSSHSFHKHLQQTAATIDYNRLISARHNKLERKILAHLSKLVFNIYQNKKYCFSLIAQLKAMGRDK